MHDKLIEYTQLLTEQLAEIEKFRTRNAKAQATRIRTRHGRITQSGKALRKAMLDEVAAQ